MTVAPLAKGPPKRPHRHASAPDEKSLSDLRDEHAAWAETLPTTTSCARCRWTHTGTAAEGREAFTAHRLTKHPEVKPSKKRRPQQKGHIPMSPIKNPELKAEGHERAASLVALHARRERESETA